MRLPYVGVGRSGSQDRALQPGLHGSDRASTAPFLHYGPSTRVRVASLLFYDMTHTMTDIENLNENRLEGQRRLDTDFVSVGCCPKCPSET